LWALVEEVKPGSEAAYRWSRKKFRVEFFMQALQAWIHAVVLQSGKLQILFELKYLFGERWLLNPVFKPSIRFTIRKRVGNIF
jgi:hypothetical protein